MRRIGLIFLMAAVGSCRAEVSCFRTPAQAAVQVGVQEGGGYRLEYVRQDPFGRRSWATVKSCAHPEWPAVLVPSAAAETSHVHDAAVATNTEHPMVVTGGQRVRVVQVDSMMRLETVGTVQASGRVGDQVPVRIAGEGNEGRVVLAVVRSAELLEMGQ